MSNEVPEAHPAATLILLRDTDDGMQVLMVRRNATLKFYGGAWAFPGGRVDPEDCVEGETQESLEAVKRAAVRELREEVALAISPEQLTWMSLWITPVVRPKRFKTWFFVAAIDDHNAQVDGGEIDAHQWLTFDQAFAAHRAQQMELPPPTFVTLSELSRFATTTEALTTLRHRAPVHYLPKLLSADGGVYSLYESDAGYADEDVTRAGARDRLVMLPSGWRYERS